MGVPPLATMFVASCNVFAVVPGVPAGASPLRGCITSTPAAH